MPISSSLAIGLAGDSFARRFGHGSYTRAYRSPTGEGHASCQHGHRFPYCLSICASAASVWGSQKVIAMARYNSTAADSSARASARRPLLA
jgi:hypothetical protein